MKHIKHIKSLLAASVLFMSFPAFSAEEAKEIKVCSAVAPMKNVVSKVKAPFEESTKIKLTDIYNDPQGVSADRVLADLDEGKCEVAFGGLDWNSWLAVMDEKKVTVKNAKDMQQQAVSRDLTQIMINKGIGIKKLDDIQLARVLSGNVKNWKEIGGADAPVVLVLTKVQLTMKKYLEKVIIGGKELRTDFKPVADFPEAIKTVATTPGGITWGPSSTVTSDVEVPNHPTIGRPMLMVVKGQYTPNIKALLDFIKKEGPKHGVPQ